MRRKITELEQKLIALYALDALGEISALQLLTFMVENDLMAYFDLQIAMYQLEALRFIQKRQHPLGALYSLTDSGWEALELFGARILQSIRQKVDAEAATYRARFAVEKTVLGDYRTLPDGRIQMELQLRQGTDWLLFLAFIKPTALSAPRAVTAFMKNAERVYTRIFKLLSLGYTEGSRGIEQLPPGARFVAEPSPLLELRSGDGPNPTLTLMLPMTDIDMACHFANRFKKISSVIMDELTALLK